jgi:hypothetical protein
MSIGLYDKAFYALISTGIMLTVSNPTTYKFFDKIIDTNSVITTGGCPTVVGHLIHSLIFFILIFSVMLLINIIKKNGSKKSSWLLLKYSFYATLLFFIVTNTEIYKLVGIITSNRSADACGCPTNFGLLLHGCIYFLIIFGVMFFPKES